MESSGKKKLLFLFPGPYWEIRASHRLRFERLSERFQGTVITTQADVPMRARVGDFDWVGLRLVVRRRHLYRLKFIFYCLWRAARARITGRGWDLVVTYDPLTTGLLAVCVARISGTKFAPEVNGVYTSKANYIDDPNPLLDALRAFLYPRLIRFTLKRADAVKALFPGQLDPLRDVLRSKRVEYLFDHVDLSPFRDLGEEKVVLFVGFPFKLKGVDLLIAAFKRLAPKYPDWKLKILGWYPDPAELNSHMGGHPQIFHHPPVDPGDMPKHLGSCGVLVLPSRTEGLSRVLLEAMASGKPRLGSRLEGIPFLIADGEDGLLFEPGNAADLADKLDRLLGDAALRARLGQAGAERARREFGDANYFERLMDFYAEVIAGPPASR